MIYVDDFFDHLLSLQVPLVVPYLRVGDVNCVPDDAECVAITHYNNSSGYSTVQRKIDILTKKQCKNILVYVNEPTNQFVDFLLKNDNPQITFYADAVLNFDLTHATYHTVINWFVDPVNVYKDTSWGKQLVNTLDHRYTESHRAYRFELLLGRQNRHRDYLYEQLLTSAVKESTIYSYFKENITDGIWDFAVDTASISTDLISDSRGEFRPSSVIPVDIYNQSYYSIIAETTVNNAYSQFTEKVVKPILGKRLFLVQAGCHYLRNLRKLGFLTFSRVIDESYDLEPDFQKRSAMLWQQVEYLNSADPIAVRKKIQDVVEHNFQVFLQTDWNRAIVDRFIDSENSNTV